MKTVNCNVPEYGCMCMDFSCRCCNVDYDGNYICQKVRYSLKEKFEMVKNVVGNESVGIHNFGILHDIAEVLGMDGNSGGNLRNLNARISKLMREFIKAGYPVKESRIKCCSWTEKETWHAVFDIEELQNG